MRLAFLSTFLSLTIVVAAIVTSAAPTDAPQPYKATAEVISQKKCTNNNSSYSLIQKLRVTFLNISKRNLIVDKNIESDYSNSLVARDARDLGRGDYEWNAHTEFTRDPPAGELLEESPVPPFVTLAPGESLQFETDFWVEVRMHDAQGYGIRSGDHVEQSEIGSWFYSTKGEEVQKRWQQFGELIYKTIRTEPLSLNLSPDPVLETCKK
jgi:hypothetical protein